MAQANEPVQRRGARRIGIKFEVRCQRENETLEDYIDYYENYCSSVGIDVEQQIKLLIAYANTKSRKRAILLRDRIHTWEDLYKHLLGRGSTMERKLARRSLENKKLGAQEDIIDHAVTCMDLVKKA